MISSISSPMQMSMTQSRAPKINNESGEGKAPVSEEEKLQKRFAKLDTNGDGKADASEIAARQSTKGANAPSAEKILKKFDTDGDGSLSRSENDARITRGQAKAAGSIDIQA